MTRRVRPPLRLGSSSACTPSGEQWRVGRRWVTRGLPRWRKVPAGKATAEALGLPDVQGPEDLAVALAVTVGVLVVAVVLIPLLLFGIELILLGMVVAAGILGRGLLGRPWIVEARLVGNPAHSFTWTVRGWRRSTRVIDEALASLSAGLEPAPAEAEGTLTSARSTR